MALFPTNAAQVQTFATALYGIQAGTATMSQVTADILAAGGLNNALNAYYSASFGSMTTSVVASTIVANVGLATDANAIAFVTAQLNASAPAARGAAVLAMLNNFLNTTTGTYAAAAAAFNATVANAVTYTGSADVASGSVVSSQAFTLTAGVDTITGTAGNDTFNAPVGSANALSFTALDNLDGGAGNDTLNITASATFASPIGVNVRNIETINLTNSTGGTTFNTATGYTGLTTLGVIVGAGADSITAAAGTNVTLTAATPGGATVQSFGGNNQTVTVTGGATGDNITVGSSTALPTGAIVVSNTASTAGGTTGNTITTVGGSSVSITDVLTNTTAAGAGAGVATTGAVSVTGSALTTSVSVTQSAPTSAAAAAAAVAGSSNAVTATRGLANGAVTVADANAASTTVANTITSVTLNNAAGASSISSTALTTLTLSGVIANTGGTTALATTEGGSTTTVNANKTLTMNTGTGVMSTTGSNTVGAYSDASNQYATINVVTSGNYYFVNANSAANNTVVLQDTALRTLNVSGTGLVGFTNAAPTTASAFAPAYTPTMANANGINTAITAINITGGASFLADLSGMTGLTTLNTAGTTGAVSVTLNGTVTSFTGGTGRTIVELTALDATKTINLGTNAANQLILTSTGSTYQATTGKFTTTNVTGYTQLGVSDSTINTTYSFDVSKFASTINTLEVWGMTTGSTNNFTGVAANTALVIDAATTQVSYELATNLSGPSSTVNVTFNGVAPTVGTGTIGYTTGTLVLQDKNTFGIGTVNLALDASVGGGSYTITNLTDPNLANLNISGTGALTITNMNTLNTVGTVVINDNSTSTASSAITNGWTGNIITNLNFTGTHAFNAGTLTDTIPSLSISNVNTGTTGVVTISQASTSTLSSLTLTGAVRYTGTDTIATAVLVNAATDNQIITLTLNGAGAHTVSMGNGANVYVGGSGVDTLTLGTGANTITTAGGADVITFAAHSGKDTVNVTGTLNSTSMVTITGFNVNTDQITLAASNAFYSALGGTAGGALAVGGLNTFQQVAGGAAITATAQVIDITGTVYGTSAANSAAALLAAISPTGSTPITAGASLTAGATGKFLVEYNGFDGLHIALVTQGTTGSAVAANSTVIDLVDLVGVGTSAGAHLGTGVLVLV